MISDHTLTNLHPAFYPCSVGLRISYYHITLCRYGPSGCNVLQPSYTCHSFLEYQGSFARAKYSSKITTALTKLKGVRLLNQNTAAERTSTQNKGSVEEETVLNRTTVSWLDNVQCWFITGETDRDSAEFDWDGGFSWWNCAADRSVWCRLGWSIEQLILLLLTRLLDNERMCWKLLANQAAVVGSRFYRQMLSKNN